MNKELVKDIRGTFEMFIRVHCNAGTSILRTEDTLPGFGTVWFDDRCIVNILSLLISKNKDRVMYDIEEVNQFIMGMPDKEVLLNEIRNGIYCHDTEDRDLVLVKTVEENQRMILLQRYVRFHGGHMGIGNLLQPVT